MEIAVSKYASARVASTCSLKEHGQMLARAIVRITAQHPEECENRM